ncbi:MAG: thermopsin family protease [Thermoproteus sp.]
MRALFFLVFLALTAYAQCISYMGTSFGGGAVYAVWTRPAVIYNADGTPVAYLSGSGAAVLMAGSGSYRSSSPLDITLCMNAGLVAERIAVRDTPWGPAAPTGLAYYGFEEAYGFLLPVPYSGDAVMGCFSLENFTAVSYTPLGEVQAYSVQLNAYIEARGGLYWAQALVRYRGGEFEFLDNLWNMTASTSTLRGLGGLGAVASLGPDQYYYYLRPLPNLGSACLEIKASGSRVEFYVNGDLIDAVELPGAARVVVLPQFNARGLPVDLELVVGGYGADAPVAKALGGRISLSLYVWNGTAFAEPPALWSVGSSTKESIIAHMDPSGVLGAGRPSVEQIKGEPPCIYFLNGSALCGGTLRQLVELFLPNGTYFLWAAGPTTLRLPEIREGLVRYVPAAPLLNFTASRPLALRPQYGVEYLVRLGTPIGVEAIWAKNGTTIRAGDFSFRSGSVAYLGEALLLRGVEFRQMAVEGPLDLSVVYTAIYNGTARDLLGLPSPLSLAVMSCGQRRSFALAGPLGRYEAEMGGVQTLCSARLYRIPISLYVVIPVAVIFPKLFRKRNIYKHQ